MQIYRYNYFRNVNYLFQFHENFNLMLHFFESDFTAVRLHFIPV